ncbi:hypothetical protein M422DRAFT_270153, partial [Sphaerobolus stellatus SS14]
PNVKSVRNLLAFSLTSPRPQPPKFIYTSSIGVFNNTSEVHEPLLEEHVSAEISAGNGYGESKWVSEQILLNVSESTPVKTLVVRLGQLSGGLNGSWNIKEWLPSMIQSSTADISWIPNDLAAEVLVDFSLADFESGSAESNGTSSETLHNVPALRLLPFFNGLGNIINGGGSEFGTPKLSVHRSMSLSKTLSDPKLEQLGEADAKAWIGHWRRMGFIKND